MKIFQFEDTFQISSEEIDNYKALLDLLIVMME